VINIWSSFIAVNLVDYIICVNVLTWLPLQPHFTSTVLKEYCNGYQFEYVMQLF